MTSPDQYFELNGHVLRYRDEGRGPAAVFLHGWTLDLDMWRAQAEVLAANYRIIRMDRRGHGYSTGAPSLAGDVADLGKLLRRLEVHRFALIGMSQGARVALKVAGAAAQGISCLVLDGPADMSLAPAPPEIPVEHYRSLARTQGLRAFRRAWAQHPLASLRTDDPNTRALLAAMLARYPARDVTDALAVEKFSVDLPALTDRGVPTLVVGGDSDSDSRKQGADWLAAQLGAQRVQIPAAGHLCNLDNPAAYNQTLKTFLDRYATKACNAEGAT